MDEGRVARRAGRPRRPVPTSRRCPGAEQEVLGAPQVGTGVTGVRVRRGLEPGVELEQQHLDRGRGRARAHRDSLAAPAAVQARRRSASGRRVETSQYGTGSAGSSRVISTAVAHVRAEDQVGPGVRLHPGPPPGLLGVECLGAARCSDARSGPGRPGSPRRRPRCRTADRTNSPAVDGQARPRWRRSPRRVRRRGRRRAAATARSRRRAATRPPARATAPGTACADPTRLAQNVERRPARSSARRRPAGLTAPNQAGTPVQTIRGATDHRASTFVRPAAEQHRGRPSQWRRATTSFACVKSNVDERVDHPLRRIRHPAQSKQ